MDTLQEKRARELVKHLADAGINCGLLDVQGAVVLRGPGSPYVDTPMVSFDATDLQNAIDLGCWLKRRSLAAISGSGTW